MLPQIEACIPALRRYALALLRNRQDADDLVHDCLVRALDRLHTRRDDGDLRAWLFTIMHNLFASQLRRWAARPDKAALDNAADAVPVHADQENKLLYREVLKEVYKLPQEQQQVILLVAVEDLSYAEVARVLNIPIGTVMSRLSRARERLRRAAQEPARPCLRRVK